MLPKELAQKIRYIEIFTRKAVNDVLAGEYASVFKGRGMEFEEVREYTPGDDIRTIDWNVTARMGHPFVKRFVEERELTIFFLVDLSGSGTFGSAGKTKNEIAAELTALLAFSAIQNHDKVGLLAFTNTIELFVPPRKGLTHVLRLIRDLLEFRPRHGGTDIVAALERLARITHKRCVVFLISDFLTEGFEKTLRILGKRHDIIALSITDPREQRWPDVGLVELEDAETGECRLIDTGSLPLRRAFEEQAKQRQERLSALFRMMRIDYAPVVAGEDYVRDLVAFFRMRERRR